MNILGTSSAKLVFILYAFASGILTTLWFGHAQFLVYTDTHFPIGNFSKYIERMFNVIDTAYFPSIYDIRHLFLYPYASIFLAFGNLTHDVFIASVAQHLFLFFLIFFSMVSIHSLIT